MRYTKEEINKDIKKSETRDAEYSTAHGIRAIAKMMYNNRYNE